MGKDKKPATSIEAFRSLDPAKISEIHKRILAGLSALGSGTYEDLAVYLRLEPQRVWRRLSELHKAGLIHRTGERKVLRSGRQGFVWREGAETTPPIIEKSLPGPSISDFSKAIQQVSSNKIQQTLF